MNKVSTHSGRSVVLPIPGQAGRPAVQVLGINWPVWCVFMSGVVFVVIEGALRKWVFPFGGGMGRYLAYFSKDIAFALLLVLPLRSFASGASVEFGKWLFAGVALLAVGTGISSLHGFNWVGAVLTLRATVALPVIAYLCIRRLGGVPVRHVAWLLAILTVLNFGLAIVQNRLPSDHFLNKYATEMEQVVEVESGVRATGTFSYITGLGILSSVGVWAGMALLSLARQKWDQIAGYIGLAAGLGCGLASVSRGPIVIAAVMLVLWMVVSRVGHRQIERSLFAAVVVVFLAWAGGLGETFSTLGEGLVQRNERAGDSFAQRGFGQFGEAYAALKQDPLGSGLGTEQVGGNFASSGEMSFTTYESQLPRIVLETGVIGLAGFVVICAGALWSLQRARRETASPEQNSMLLATQLFLLPQFYTNVIFNHTSSAFIWIIFAVVLASVKTGQGTLSSRERRKSWQARQVARS